MRKSDIRLGRTINTANTNTEKLMKAAAAAAEGVVMPDRVQFASFEHRGRKYGFSAYLVVDVDELSGRVPPVVIRRR
ncbi:hypothetical protein G6L37_00680 [Agrobacterium rubi]|nr:hypothetical protein [Agrobacterium rubi]NTF23905.1 hypothetical protein [Agrobacterium rubi]